MKLFEIHSGRVVYTLGTSSRTWEEFLEILSHYGVEAVIDVRRHPYSRFDHFKKNNLRRKLRENSIEYVFLGDELGGFREEGYEAHAESERFAKGIAELEAVARKMRAAIICAESLPWKCHRIHIGKALTKRGWEVVHVISLGRTWLPEKPPK